jgi:RNA polymerase sigma-70 factor, ECF subfamily
MVDSDEISLIRRARDDTQAFVTLYERYVERIYRFAYRRTHDEPLARDITSTTFEKALRSLRRFEWRGVSFGAWLYKIARNEIAHHYRRWFFVPLLTRYPTDLDVERTVQSNQDRDSIYAGLAKLSGADRELIMLRYFEDLSSAEVAEILGCSVDNVYLRLHRALGRLRKNLESFEFNEVQYAHE